MAAFCRRLGKHAWQEGTPVMLCGRDCMRLIEHMQARLNSQLACLQTTQVHMDCPRQPPGCGGARCCAAAAWFWRYGDECHCQLHAECFICLAQIRTYHSCGCCAHSTPCPRSSLCRCRQDQHRRYGETHQGASAAASWPRTSCKAARKEESGGSSCCCCWGAAAARSAAGCSTGAAAALSQAAAAAGAGDGGCHAGVSGAKLRCSWDWRGRPAVPRVGGWRQRAALLQQAQVPAWPAASGAAGEHRLPVLGYAVLVLR